ncbi:hypothetical protein TNIN_207141 [Trichonephila inaurata madagascariensis]|uniref:Uncharacterized protein n=1 Tax=Trichonephila inaurata madagascariensis TaxID=2747483 RepID=A0A8X6WX30_9ARAC|nr:hypothetical protein TNIN_207141 [Trichonephila inaurata madagascariensis]
MFWSTAFALPAYAGNYNTFAGSLNLLAITETREDFEKGGKSRGERRPDDYPKLFRQPGSLGVAQSSDL